VRRKRNVWRRGRRGRRINRRRLGRRGLVNIQNCDHLHFSMLNLSMPKIAKNAVKQKIYYKKIMML
jgi:hypothetical protein